MNISLFLQLTSTGIMVVGIIFGIKNILQYEASRKRESAIVMLNSFQTPEFVKGLLLILNLPDHISKKDFEALPEANFLAIYMVVGTWERLGVLVYRREIELDLVDDAFSGPIIQTWKKLGRYIKEFRSQLKRDTAMEWLQWLAERMIERENMSPPVPAYQAFKNWQAKK